MLMKIAVSLVKRLPASSEVSLYSLYNKNKAYNNYYYYIESVSNYKIKGSTQLLSMTK